MQTFEYNVVDMLDPDSLSTRVPSKWFIARRLNEFAKDGWRVVHFDPMCTVLERPVVSNLLVEG